MMLNEFIDRARAINLRLMLLELEPMPKNGPPPYIVDFRHAGSARLFDASGGEILDEVLSIDLRTGRARVLERGKSGRPEVSVMGDLSARTTSYAPPITLLPLPGKLRALREELRGPSHPFELPGGQGEDLRTFFAEVHEEAEWLGSDEGSDLDWAFRRGWAAGNKRAFRESWIGFVAGTFIGLILVTALEALVHCFWG